MQVRKPAEVVHVDMHDSTSVADVVVEVEEEHRDQNLPSLDLASEQGKSGFRDPSEEQYSPNLTDFDRARHYSDRGQGPSGRGGRSYQ